MKKRLSEELDRLVGHSVTIVPMGAYDCHVAGTLKKEGSAYSVDTTHGNASAIFYDDAVQDIDTILNKIYL